MKPAQDLTDALERLGFSPYEAHAYCALIGQPPLNGSEIGRRAQVPPSKIYETLARLQAKGAVMVNRSDPVLYAAVPYADLLAAIRKRFETDFSCVQDGLAQLPQAATSGLVWSLSNRDGIVQAMTAAIQQARHTLYVGIWEEEMPYFHAALEQACNKRGVQTHIACYGARPVPGAHNYDLSQCGASARLRLAGRRLAVVVADDLDAIVAEFGPKARDEAVLTNNRIACLLAVEYLKADISGRLLIDAMPRAAYEKAMDTDAMRAVLAPVDSSRG